MKEAKEASLERAELFLTKIRSCTDKIAKNSHPFISDGHVSGTLFFVIFDGFSFSAFFKLKSGGVGSFKFKCSDSYVDGSQKAQQAFHSLCD